MPAHTVTGGGAGIPWRTYAQRVLSFVLGLVMAAAIIYTHVKLYKLLPAYRDFCDSFWEEQKLIVVVLILGAAVGVAYTVYSVNGRHKKFGHAIAAALGVALAPALFGFTYPELRQEIRTIRDKIEGKYDSAAPGRSAAQDALLAPEHCRGYVRTSKVASRKRLTIEVGNCAIFLSLASEQKVAAEHTAPAVRDEKGNRIAVPVGAYSIGINNPPLIFRRELVGDSVEGYVVALWCPRGTKAPCKNFN